MHDGSGDRHGRGSGVDEGPCMIEAVTDMAEGQTRERRQTSVAWKAMDRFLHEWTAGQEPVQQVLRTGRNMEEEREGQEKVIVLYTYLLKYSPYNHIKVSPFNTYNQCCVSIFIDTLSIVQHDITVIPTVHTSTRHFKIGIVHLKSFKTTIK
jgi:hypothetical protein